MKHRALLAVVIVFCLCLAWAGNREIVSAEDYTGTWYASVNGGLYEFREGIIVNAEHQLLLTEAEPFSGAYVFDRNSILVFARGVPGLEEVQELHLVKTAAGDSLCAKGNGSEVYFRRVPQQ